MKVKDLNGVEVSIEDGYLNAVTVDPKDVEYLEEMLNPEVKKIHETLLVEGIFTLKHLKSRLNISE